jgi:hypothetical protein
MKNIFQRQQPTTNNQQPTSTGVGGRKLDVFNFLRCSVGLAIFCVCLFAVAQSSNNVPGAADYAKFSRFVTERNIFDPNRQPHYTSSRSSHTHTHTHSSSAPAFTLVGTMSYEKGLFGFFSGNSDELKQVLPTSGKIAGYTVTEIAQDRVTLESADKKQKLEMRVGDVMRQENGKWELSGSGETPAGSSTTESAPNAGKDSTNGGNESPAASPSTSEPNDILKRLMEKREQENK